MIQSKNNNKIFFLKDSSTTIYKDPKK
jgi:hypothetical protein